MEEGLIEFENRTREILKTVDFEVIGARVRRERLSQNLSIRDLAGKANLSPHSITRLESGESFRAITLLKVCSALAIHVDRIASPIRRDIAAIHRKSENRWHQLDKYTEGFFGGTDGVLTEKEREEITAKSGQNPLVILNSRLDSGVLLSSVIEVRLPSEPRSHPGEELVYALNGPVKVIVNDENYILETGDSLVFWGTEIHSYAPVGDQVGLLLSVRARL